MNLLQLKYAKSNKGSEPCKDFVYSMLQLF